MSVSGSATLIYGIEVHVIPDLFRMAGVDRVCEGWHPTPTGNFCATCGKRAAERPAWLRMPVMERIDPARNFTRAGRQTYGATGRLDPLYWGADDVASELTLVCDWVHDQQRFILGVALAHGGTWRHATPVPVARIPEAAARLNEVLSGTALDRPNTAALYVIASLS